MGAAAALIESTCKINEDGSMTPDTTHYKVTVQATYEYGSFETVAHGSTIETVEENALWVYNRGRAHDGLPPLNRMPACTKYTRIEAEA